MHILWDELQMSLHLQCLRKGTIGSIFADARKQSLHASNYYDDSICS